MEKTVIELFAGVGGFRIGLNHVLLGKDGKAIEKNNFKFVFSNQWEPSTKIQHAFECYYQRFYKEGSDEIFSNEDISLIDKKTIPDFTLLTGGFPCQDYSVARSLSKEKGIEGKKGVLWWQINDILKIKKPPFVLLENVDRLLKSPSKQRGRDFGIMLKCFAELDYSVEWRVINAAEYGHPQKRRRIYIFAYKNTTTYAKKINKLNPEQILKEDGIYAKTFPVEKNINIKSINIGKDYYEDLVAFSNKFSFDFKNGGSMIKNSIFTAKLTPIYEQPINLGDIILKEKVSENYFLSNDQIKKFEFLKGSKKIKRTNSSGFEYFYSEGSMTFPDSYNMPGRTMLTSEGTINRSTHVIKDRISNKKRTLTPIECERLNQFPDNRTNTMSDKRRYFMMGNALVTGIIKKIGFTIQQLIENEK